MAPQTFGATVRRERERQKIGLRQAAKAISVSPTYLSMVERDEFQPPAEDKVRAIAKLLGLDEDELLALAGKVSSDLTEIIRKHPREMASFLRSMKGMSPEQVSQRLGGAKPKKESS
jgi:transcriptional regulator with XRE-family HTH domain